jgi:DNA polymerase-3 subunit delta
MKLSGAEALRSFARPDPARPGMLIHGADPMRVADRRRQLVTALIGPEGAAEMRLTRIAAADLRRDPAAAGDAMRAQGFFPGPRAVLVEDAGDSVTDTLAAALADWRPGDAALVVTAGDLPAKSTLRRLFEGHPAALSAALYDDPPTRDEIDEALRAAGLTAVDRAAMADLVALAQAIEPGDFRQTVEKIGLYKWGDPSPLTPEDVAACAPATLEAAVDDVLHAVAESRTTDIGPLMVRLAGQGVAPVTLCIGALRHFRTLHAASADPGGPAAGRARARPPVFGPRRDRMLRQAQRWSVARLEEALALIVDTDLTLRSASRAPAMAVIERALIRLSTLGKR